VSLPPAKLKAQVNSKIVVQRSENEEDIFVFLNRKVSFFASAA